MSENKPVLPGDYLNLLNDFIQNRRAGGFLLAPHRVGEFVVAVAAPKQEPRGNRLTEILGLFAGDGLVVAERHFYHPSGMTETHSATFRTIASPGSIVSRSSDIAGIGRNALRFPHLMSDLRSRRSGEDVFASEQARAILDQAIAGGVKMDRGIVNAIETFDAEQAAKPKN